MGFRSITKKVIPTEVFRAIEPAGHHAEAIMLNALAGMPHKGLKVIGVTGTNGKTSTAFLIHRMLVEAGYKVGLMTTVAYGVGDDIKPQVAHMTSVSVPELIKRVKSMKKQGMEWLVLEVTSHALAQNRVWSVPFEIAVLTNLTHEHLDYHGTFERYRDAKRKLFTQTDKNKRGLRLGIVNAEDDSAALFVSDIKHSITYGMKDGDLRARSVRLSPSGSRYIVDVDGVEHHIHCRLPGSFNVYNSLAAVGVGKALGLTKQQIEQGIAALTGVEGRMTVVDEGQDFEVIVDYAHTPDSFEKLFKDMKPMIKGKLIVMFGSAGRRDEAKRYTQGELAGKYADEVIITEEDDRDMDGQAIMEQIAEGAQKAGKTHDRDLFMVHDRSEAINFAVKRAKKGDTVLLLGKGHEKDILRNGPKAAEMRHLPQDDHNPSRVVEHKWDEIAEARKALDAL
ncbi:UDP-N-acetylmuramoyl-L-alanyl-D-glutamate--2,6-diaminopimelate ligase [Candidatus Saccharibacteria bacterium]|nr:UDP-N-acetylmuramoyl-L-alanyl-D-glutamate--2,6-diaminopimelate ligase [Candidatus Saccharibacteria bacterium]